MGKLKFTGLNNVLKQFDNHGWKGSFSTGPWQIGNGGYDLWFELYYQGEPVARCIYGELESNFGLEQSDKEELFSRILKVYDNLKIKEEPELEEDEMAYQSTESLNKTSSLDEKISLAVKNNNKDTKAALQTLKEIEEHENEI